jgi:CHASE2 domain-containing sensor protein
MIKQFHNFFVEWVLIFGCGVLGAFLVASNSDATKWGYVVFIFSSCSTMVLTMRDSRFSIAALNGIYLCINVYGVYNYMFRDSDLLNKIIISLSNLQNVI